MTAQRKLINSGSPLEKHIGFSRAVRIGKVIAISGTAPINQDGTDNSPGDVYSQTRRCLEIIAQALADADAGMDDVIRTRIMLTDISHWEEAAKAHGEVFSSIRPACTFVEVKGFIRPAWLVEMEADAVVEG
jgi:enamine deaminase RidA (YjgF/YER057c/UK114 family)